MDDILTSDDALTMDLIYSLIGFPLETEWLEFKESQSDPESIGRDISALANSAAYHGRDCAYKVWGVTDKVPRELVGTSFRPLKKKGKGSQDLAIWLRQELSANANYDFLEVDHNGSHFVVLEVRPSSQRPVSFKGVPWIREGSSTTKLVGGSEREAELWSRLQTADFESQIAEKDVTEADVMEKLDVGAYFRALKLEQPSTVGNALKMLCEQDLVRKQDNKRYSITNLGALLIAKKLTAFPGLRKRALRVVRFDGTARMKILKDEFFDEGYVTALPRAIEYVTTIAPATEVLEGAYRKIRMRFPEAAVRELLSNTVIHQDMSDTTLYPEVHVFDDRMEFTNPGVSLVPEERILNALPKTRNVMLVGILRQMDLCEEEGTGWDIIVAACEEAHLRAPSIFTDERTGTEITLFGDGAYARMTKKERMDAVYWHACLQYAQRQSMSNQSLRERFGLEDDSKNVVAISRLIKECCDSGLIKEEDPDAGNKYRRYIPEWA